MLIIISLASLLFLYPDASKRAVLTLNDILVNKLGFFYILMGLFMLFGCIYTAYRHGNIKLGNCAPKYGNFRWGAMIFTSTMAADILYWSLIEWAYYYSSNPMGREMSDVQRQIIASAYPLFHWGPIPWAFYILPATCYAYMFFVKGRTRQTLSEACRPLLNEKTDGFAGKFIDIFSVVGLIGGTATTFSLATPLLSSAAGEVFNIADSRGLTIMILCIIGVTFTLTVMFGMKAITKLALICVYLFAALLLYVFVFGPSRFIIESGISGIGYAAQNFISMATWTDPLRLTGDGVSGFPQQWTIFYWAYWIAWFVATPFFIAKISEGRTVRQLISGAFFFGITGTFTSFIVFGNFGLYQQTQGFVDASSMLNAGIAPSQVILKLFMRLPVHNFALFLLILAMIAFYASTFDAITLVVAGFCRKSPAADEQSEQVLRAFWAIIFIILPIALIWSESTLTMLLTLSIATAFPLAIISLIIVFSLLKELKKG